VNRSVLSKLALFALAFATVTLFAQPSPSSVTSPTPRKTITAVFWNIQWFPGRRPNANRYEELRQLDSVHRDMIQFDSDLIGMEEVRDAQHAALAVQSLPGFKIDVCSNFPPHEDQQGTQQLAIASRLQPISAWAESWKRGRAMTPPRGFAFAAYQVAFRQVLLVYVVHLKSNRGRLREDMVIREESIRQLLSHIRAMTDIYGKLGASTCIVGGDFNTSPDDKRFALERTTRQLLTQGFTWSWQNVPLASRITLPPNKLYPAACFDHIFYRGAALQRAWVVKTSMQSSDHRAIEAIIDLAPAAP